MYPPPTPEIIEDGCMVPVADTALIVVNANTAINNKVGLPNFDFHMNSLTCHFILVHLKFDLRLSFSCLLIFLAHLSNGR